MVDTRYSFDNRKKFPLEGRQLLPMKSGIVHKLTCSCGFTYIGQTRRNLHSRIKERATSEKFEVCKYLLQPSTFALILLHLEFRVVRMILLGCRFWNRCSFKNEHLNLAMILNLAAR